jgi:hypothetical protein
MAYPLIVIYHTVTAFRLNASNQDGSAANSAPKYIARTTVLDVTALRKSEEIFMLEEARKSARDPDE